MKRCRVLSVAHTVWLTREQRYSLAGGETVEVVGTSVPVWFYKGTTSEPAQELFCKYVLMSSEPQMCIRHLLDGYEINVPRDPIPPDVPEAVWVDLDEDEKKKLLEKAPQTEKVANLLDEADGGVRWFYFQQYVKIHRQDGSQVDLQHYVELRDIESLTETILN